MPHKTPVFGVFFFTFSDLSETLKNAVFWLFFTFLRFFQVFSTFRAFGHLGRLLGTFGHFWALLAKMATFGVFEGLRRAPRWGFTERQDLAMGFDGFAY